MKKKLLSIVIAACAVASSQAQTKIYDFSFDNTLSANAGSGAFVAPGSSFVADRNAQSNMALSINQVASSTLTNLPQGKSPRTVSLWFNRRGPALTGLFAYGSDSALKRFGIYFDAIGSLVFQAYGAGNDEELNISGVAFQTWHHLVVSYDGDSVSVYFNNRLTNRFARDLNTGGDLPFSLGNVAAYFDDLKIYDGAVTAAQVNELFTNNDISSSMHVAGLSATQALKVYPNPSNGVLYLEAHAAGKVRITNLNGTVMSECQVDAGLNTLPVADLSKGIYFIQHHGAVVKFIKE